MELIIEIDDPKRGIESSLMAESMRIRDAMLTLSRQELSPETAKKYAMGLGVPKMVGPMEAVMSLKGFLPTALESGMKGFDMKPSWLASPKAKVAKDGSLFMAIPITKNGITEFRTMSTKSPKKSWRHPGIHAYNFFEKAVERLYS